MLKKRMLYSLIFITILGATTTAVLRLPQFGRLPSKERLARITQSPNFREGAFQNLHETPNFAEDVSGFAVFKKFFFSKVADKEPSKPIPSIKTDLKALNSSLPQVVWFGHSSYLLKINGKTILVDPVFSGYSSPFSFASKNFKGSNVYAVEDFPEIDVLLITHDHYDHLDYETVKKLLPKVKMVVTSLGVGEHLEMWGYDPSKIKELDWWESTQTDSSIQITAAPARHFSGRLFKRNQSLWSSFILKVADYQLYLGGDSGYDTHFKEIGDKFGGFDFALLECGQYNYDWKYIHMMPEETAHAAQDLKAKVLMPVHWGKFALALHAWNEPAERVTKEAIKINQSITTPMIGEVVEIGGTLPQKTWWRF